MPTSPDWFITLACLGLAVAVLAVAVWQTSRPRKDSIKARWMPWRFVILLTGAVLAYGLIHLMTLLGVEPRPPRGF